MASPPPAGTIMGRLRARLQNETLNELGELRSEIRAELANERAMLHAQIDQVRASVARAAYARSSWRPQGALAARCA